MDAANVCVVSSRDARGGLVVRIGIPLADVYLEFPRPFQDRFGGLNHDSWRVLRCDHERRAGRGKVTKLR